MENKETTFNKSLEMHQKLIDTMLLYKNENGICKVSQKELSEKLKRHQTWVSKAIERINTEDECIKKVKPGEYIINYSELVIRGTFKKILELMLITLNKPEIIYMNENEISKQFDVKIKTIQMYKSYLLTGWKKEIEKFSTKIQY